MSTPSHRKSVPRFIVVGVLAALVHLAAAAVFVEAAGLSPLWANALSFICAFSVSFSGHFYWTFSASSSALASSGLALWPALLRFFCIALCGFVLNQILYAGLLSLSGGRYYLAILGFVLFFVAALTYLLSRYWGFKRP